MQLDSANYKYSNAITHQGVAMTFSAQQSSTTPGTYRIGYTVLTASTAKGSVDKAWTNFEPLKFPKQIRPGGMSLVTLDLVSGQDTGSLWNITTPFQVLSDGQYVYLFRQSTKSTLLVDRFVMEVETGKLSNAWEVRFRRSRKADVPSGPQDTLGSTDMEGKPFIEPTTDLNCIFTLYGGYFSVLILPTDLQSVSRWQIFVYNGNTGCLDSYSILRSANGLFDFSDYGNANYQAPYWWPLPQQSFSLANGSFGVVGQAALLYAKQEQISDEYGRSHLFKKEARVMVAIPLGGDSSNAIAILDFGVSREGKLAQVAPYNNANPVRLSISPQPAVCNSLLFDPAQHSQVTVPSPSVSLGGAFSIEAWVNLTRHSSGNDFIFQGGLSAGGSFCLLVSNGVPVFTVTSSSGSTPSAVSGPAALENNTWYHLAGTWDEPTCCLYINGQLNATLFANPPVSSATGWLMGGQNGFAGYLQEVRLWNTALAQTDILSDMATPLTSPYSQNLVAYWPMTEPSDGSQVTTVPNLQNPSANNGILQGAVWSAGTAPLGTSMPVVAWDAKGLSVATTQLTFARTTSAPFLFAGADGQVHLYFANLSTNSFYAAHYNTVTARANYTVPWTTPDSSGLVRFIARQPGTQMNKTYGSLVLVEIVTDPSNSLLYQVTLQTNMSMTELWPRVPTNLESFLAVLNGLAVAPGPVAQAQGVVQYDYTQVQLTSGYGQTEGPRKPGTGSGIFTVMADTYPDDGQQATVSTTTTAPAMMDKVGADCWWVVVQPPPCLMLNGTGSGGQYIQVLTSNPSYEGMLKLRGDLCVEAWINPTSFRSHSYSSLVLYQQAGLQYMLGLDGKGRLFAQNTAGARISTAAAPTNSWTHVAANFESDLCLQLNGQQYVDAGKGETMNTAEAITVEAWLRWDRETSGPQVAISKWATAGKQSWQLYLDPDHSLVFEVNRDSGRQIVRTNAGAIQVREWNHIAGVYDISYKKEFAVQCNSSQQSYVNIDPSNPLLDDNPSGVTVEAWVYWGGGGANQVTVIGECGPSNTKAGLTIDSFRFPTFNVVLAGAEFSLSMVAKVALPAGVWTHLAGSYDKTTGNQHIYVNGMLSDISTPNSDPGYAPAPLSQIYIGWNGDPTTTTYYQGDVNEVRLWNRSLSLEEIRENMTRSLSGQEDGLVGYWPLQEHSGQTAYDRAGSNNGTLNGGAQFVAVRKGAFAQKLFLNGGLQSSSQAGDASKVTDAPLYFGAAATANSANYLQGTISNIRLWKIGRMDWQISAYSNKEVKADSEGLVSDWQFKTETGRVIADSKGNNEGEVKEYGGQLTDENVKKMWLRAAFGPTRLTLYINGVEAQASGYASPPTHLADQCSLGGVSATAGTNFSGLLGEIRVWKGRRSARQLFDNMNRSLSGHERNLVTYWPINTGGNYPVGGPGQVIADQTDGGSNGILQGGPPMWQVFTPPGNGTLLPVGGEIPAVVNAGAVSTTPTSQIITATPAVIEYGRMDADTAGVPVGALERCYVYVDNQSRLNVITNFQTGELDVQYVGQVQTKPTVVGYIEGAPPLPSENLTVDSPITPYKYLAASSVTLTEAENTAYVYTASRDLGFDHSSDLKAGVAFGFKTGVVSIVGFSFEVGDFKFGVGVHAAFDFSLGWLSEAKVSSEKKANINKTIEVFGAWQDMPAAYQTVNQSLKQFTNVPRYYLPNNKGLAMVKSGVADIYALRLRGVGSLVAYSLRPNPDIPEDTNLIMFVINPSYVKNGTLDGWFGFVNDQDYFLAPGSFGSYFKPLEAYALKQQIEREQAQLQTWYEQFDAGSIGRRQSSLYYESGDPGSGNTSLTNLLMTGSNEGPELSTDDWKKKMARRSLANTYVWNSDGGLYSEQQQFATVREESWGGSYDFVGKAGYYVKAEAMTGPEGSADLLFGGHIRTKTMKTRQEGDSFGIEVNLPGEGFLNQRLPQASLPPGQYPVPYGSNSDPGKVNQYRFMTFHLSPNKHNFEELKKIIDPDWLNGQGDYAGSYDPDAFALKQALSNTNEVWRVLHRVTYVNRIPLVSGSSDTYEGESLPPSVRQPDALSVVNNFFLISQSPIPAGDSNPLATISGDISNYLEALENNELWGALLVIQFGEIKQDIMTFMEYRAYHMK